MSHTYEQLNDGKWTVVYYRSADDWTIVKTFRPNEEHLAAALVNFLNGGDGTLSGNIRHVYFRQEKTE